MIIISYFVSQDELPLKKRVIIKDEDDMKPLPNPFPMPKHFSKDIEIALQSKKNDEGYYEEVYFSNSKFGFSIQEIS